MGQNRLKQGFTSGEITPHLHTQVANERYRSGASTLKNMMIVPQGPCTRRPGTKFVYNITDWMVRDCAPVDWTSLNLMKPRLIPFIFDENQSYILIFYEYVNGVSGEEGVHMFIADGASQAIIEDPSNPGYPYDITIANWGTGSDPNLPINSMDYTQSADVLYLAIPNQLPIKVTRSGVTSWAATRWDSAKVPPDNDWGGAGLDGPHTVAFFEQRLCWAGNNDFPHKVWMSAAGDFEDYDWKDTSGTKEQARALAFTLDSGTINKVVWLLGSTQLLLGTLGDEWSISGVGYEAISTVSFSIVRHTNRGSKPKIKPIPINSSTIFAEKFGRVLNRYTYDYYTSAYTTMDLSALAPHLTKETSIYRMAYQQVPYSIIWCVKDNTKLMALTYEPDHKVFGWHRHDSENGFYDVQVIPGSDQDDVWFLVKGKQTVSGGSDPWDKYWYLEVMAPEFVSNDLTDARYLDSHVVYSGAAVNAITSGLSHFEGQTVSIMADGGSHPDRTVSSGAIELNDYYTHVVIGYNYNSDVEPIMPELELQDGTTVSRMKRTTEIRLMLDKTVGYQYGKNFDEMDVAYFRAPDDTLDEALPPFSGIHHIQFPEGPNRETSICIRQNNAMPMTIVGIVDDMEVSE